MALAIDTDTFLLVLTGAGISAESGVPTFRDAGGLWEGRQAARAARSRDPGHRRISRFKDALRDAPEERERWLAFQKGCVHRRIRRWLESEEIEALTGSGN